MVSRLNPYLSFRDTARPALEFYQGVFGGDLVVNTFGEFGAPEGPGSDLVMHGMLSTPSGFTLMAADTPPDVDLTPGSQITVSLSGDATEELHGYWDRLVDGGTVTMPLEKQMWGDDFGMCLDQFGISWMVNIGQPEG